MFSNGVCAAIGRAQSLCKYIQLRSIERASRSRRMWFASIAHECPIRSIRTQDSVRARPDDKTVDRRRRRRCRCDRASLSDNIQHAYTQHSCTIRIASMSNTHEHAHALVCKVRIAAAVRTRLLCHAHRCSTLPGCLSVCVRSIEYILLVAYLRVRQATGGAHLI